MPFLLGDHILLRDRYFYWDPPDYYGKPELTRPCRFVDVTHLLLESGDLAGLGHERLIAVAINRQATLGGHDLRQVDGEPECVVQGEDALGIDHLAAARVGGFGEERQSTVEGAEEAVDRAQQALGGLDALVNNAGLTRDTLLVRMSDDQWDDVMQTNLRSAFVCSRRAVREMIRRRKGRIVNIASVHGHKIIPGAFPYPVAKHGLIGLTRSLGIEYADRGIRVNSISPGLIRTPAAETWLAT